MWGILKGRNGGEIGIRTRDTLSRIHAFQACAFSHSAISPLFLTTVLILLKFKINASKNFRFYENYLIIKQ